MRTLAEKRHFPQCLPSQRGSAYIALVAALPLCLALAIYVLHFSRSLDFAFRDARFEARRRTLEVSISRSVRSGILLYSSVLPVHQPENNALYKCLFNEPGDLPGDCQAVAGQPIAFYDDESVKLSGSSSATAQCYSESGEVAVAGPSCVFQVWSEMKPLCAGGTVACNVAKGMDVTFHFESAAVSSGIHRTEHVFNYYVPFADLNFGGVSLLTWDFQSPIVWDDGQSLPYTSGRLMMMSIRVGCIDVVGTSCGSGIAGLSTKTGGTLITSVPPPPPPPPPPGSSSCPPGYRPTGTGCVLFNL